MSKQPVAISRALQVRACAALADYFEGSITVSAPMAGSFYQIYVADAPGPKTPSLGMATFDNVADLGSTSQSVVAIEVYYRWFGDPVDVKAGQNVGWTTSFYSGGGEIGAYAPVWRSDGSRIGYAFGCGTLYSIVDQPPVNTQGEQPFFVDGVPPCVMARGPTPSEMAFKETCLISHPIYFWYGYGSKKTPKAHIA